MKWKKYTIYTTTEAEDLVSMMLIELGAEGVQIEDNVPLSETDTKGMFIDILPELPPDDGKSRISFFLHLDENGTRDGIPSPGKESAASDCHKTQDMKKERKGGKQVLSAAADNSYTVSDRLWKDDEIDRLLLSIREGLLEMSSYIDIGEGRIEEGVTEDTDWRDNWKNFFKPVRTGDFLVMPSWEEVPGELLNEVSSGSIKVISIDPGTAFGTGSHETTRLCLDALTEYIHGGESVLDIGTGSGILAIAALKEGALMASATELDPQCESSITDNMALNMIPDESFRLFIGNIIDDGNIRKKVHKASPDDGKYDVVTANILAPVICTLAAPGMADSFTRDGGIFITSGIADERLADVKRAFSLNPAWEIIDISVMGEWCSVKARKRA